MKKYFSLLCFFLAVAHVAISQVTCIYCYQQNDSISANVTNLVQNGSFENTNCIMNQSTSSYCPASQYYSCSIPNWTCTGGGNFSYPSFFDTTYIATGQGTKGAYLGNGIFAHACSTINHDTTCFVDSGCTVTGIPNGYPDNTIAFGGTTGVSLEQTVSSLIPGNTYVLEFWAGGEMQINGWTLPGLFAVDVGFGKIFLRCKPTGIGYTGTRYIVEFNAVSSTQTIKFTNWGHICISCTELIVDDVRLYTIAELSASLPSCQPNSVSEVSTEISPSTICLYQLATIRFGKAVSGATFTLYNLLGEKVAETSGIIGESFQFTRGNTQSGVYVYEVREKDKTIARGKAVIY